MIAGKILFVIFLVLANGFFVAAEFALVKVRTSQIETLAKTGSFFAKLSQTILQHLDAYLSGCQLGITLTSLGLGWVGEDTVAEMLHGPVSLLGLPTNTAEYIALPLSFVVITFLHITIGEQAPKILAIQKARVTTLAVSLPLFIFFQIFKPFIWFLNWCSNMMLRVVGIQLASEHERIHTEDELRLILVESAAGGTLSRRERLMMENVLDLENKVARQVMVPRCDIISLDTENSLEENVKCVSESGHTRFPVCNGSLDHVVGMVHSKDVLRAVLSGEPIKKIADVARTVPIVPETIRLDALLLEFQRNRIHLAILVDEYGVVSGMVTFENVLEELVGPIQDEFDKELPKITRENGKVVVDAACTLAELEEFCPIILPEVEADTTGGLVVEMLGHIPEVGETLSLGNYNITVVESEPTRVRRVELAEAHPAKSSSFGLPKAESPKPKSTDSEQFPKTNLAE